MPTQHVVVDGSNIATESRQTPSLAQLESALEELRKDFPENEITVVVDATFAHRIDPSELSRYEEAMLRGDLVSPPAGAIGRGDAFLLRIAEKVDGTVLSNDSFQEFHGEHPWLFERGRLIGATPVPGVGWIFVPRTPVRGPKSRVAVRDASRAHARVTEAIATATREVEDPEATAEEKTKASAGRDGRRRQQATPQAVNDPITFISFIAEHKLGDEVDAEIESFTSHGAVARYDGVQCYVPLANLADPPPRSAREILHKGETLRLVITALDPYRRGVELALPGVANISGRPREETVEAEVRLSRRSGRSAQKPAASSVEAAANVGATEVQAPSVRSRRHRRPSGIAATSPEAPILVAAADPGTAVEVSRSRRRAKAVPGVEGNGVAAVEVSQSATPPAVRRSSRRSAAVKEAPAEPRKSPSSTRLAAKTASPKSPAPTKVTGASAKKKASSKAAAAKRPASTRTAAATSASSAPAATAGRARSAAKKQASPTTASATKATAAKRAPRKRAAPMPE